MSTSTEWKLPAGPVTGVPSADELKFLERLGFKQSFIMPTRWVRAKDSEWAELGTTGDWVQWNPVLYQWQARPYHSDPDGYHRGGEAYFTSPQLTPVLVFLELEKGNGS